jgi:hypothetical protein
VLAGGLEHRRPGAPGPAVEHLPMGARMLAQHRRHLRARARDRDHLPPVELAGSGMGARRRQGKRQQGGYRGSSESSRACCQGS